MAESERERGPNKKNGGLKINLRKDKRNQKDGRRNGRKKARGCRSLRDRERERERESETARAQRSHGFFFSLRRSPTPARGHRWTASGSFQSSTVSPSLSMYFTLPYRLVTLAQFCMDLQKRKKEAKNLVNVFFSDRKI